MSKAKTVPKHKQKLHSRLTRRQLLKYGVYGGLAAGLQSSLWLTGCSRRQSKRPNFVFILVDALRPDHLPAHGYEIDTAPNIQRLVQQAVLFERVIAPSSWTKTSMASIMAGCNPSRHGVQGVKDVLPSRLTTLAEELADNGYWTIGINTNPWLKPQFGFNVGYHIYQTLPITYEWGNASDVNREAITLLGKNAQKQPFFLYLHYMDVHSPYLPEAPFFSAPPLTIPGRGTIMDYELERLYRQENFHGPGVQQRVIDLYNGEIRTADAAISQLLKDLKELGRFDNTIFVITADHGEEFREHGKTEHGKNLYPEVYEVPLILFGPDWLPTGRRISAQVRSIDIAPTLLVLANLPVPEQFDGEPLLPMRTDVLQDRIAVGAVGLNDWLPELDYGMVVSREYLYLRERNNNVIEFYDLQSDPGAKNNLGASHPKVAAYAELEEDIATRTTEQTELDQQTIDQLKSLGYLR